MLESEARREQKKIKLRKCCTCGKPTPDYRCAKCWTQLQGFDPKQQEDTYCFSNETLFKNSTAPKPND